MPTATAGKQSLPLYSAGMASDLIKGQRGGKIVINLDELVEKQKAHWDQRRIEWSKEMEVLRLRMERSDDLRVQQFRRRAERVVRKLNRYEPGNIGHWFDRETWTVHEALVLLCDFAPIFTSIENIDDIWWEKGLASKRRYVVRLDQLDLGKIFVQEVMGKNLHDQMIHTLKTNYKALLILWNTGWHTQDRYSPQYFILWAMSKKFTINWIDLAIKHGYFAEQGGVFPSISTLLIHVALMRDAEQVVELPFENDNSCLRQIGNSTESRVAWRIILDENIALIDRENGGKAKVMQVIRWLKEKGGDRITTDGNFEELVWIDDNRGRQTVAKKTISNAIGVARVPRLSAQVPA